MAKKVIKRDQLIKGQIYLLDNYSKSTGAFEEMTEDNKHIVIRFRSINNVNYHVSRGLITFRFYKDDNNIAFYQEINKINSLISQY